VSKEDSSFNNDFTVKPMFSSKGFGRDLFVTEQNERIRELGGSRSRSPSDSDQHADMFDLQRPTYETYYPRKISTKPVTGVKFYQTDVKRK
jgi:hypothetical protein